MKKKNKLSKILFACFSVVFSITFVFAIPFIFSNNVVSVDAAYTEDTQDLTDFKQDTLYLDTLQVVNLDYESSSIYDIERRILGGGELTQTPLSEQIRNYYRYTSPFVNNYSNLTLYRVMNAFPIENSNIYSYTGLHIPLGNLYESEGMRYRDDNSLIEYLKLYLYADNFLLFNDYKDFYNLRLSVDSNAFLISGNVSFYTWYIDIDGVVNTLYHYFDFSDVRSINIFNDYTINNYSVVWSYITNLEIELSFSINESYVDNPSFYGELVVDSLARNSGDSELGSPFIFWLNYQIDNVNISDGFDMVAWLANSVNGFLSIELIPGFALISIVATFLGLSIFIAFLKIFAGG